MIETDRLLLRPHQIADARAYAALWRAPPPRYPREVPQVTLDAEAAWSRLLRFVGHRAALGYAPWVIVEKSTGALVGEAGFADFRRGLGARFDGVPEAMWKIEWDRHGEGIAREALAAIVARFDADHDHPRTVCIIDPRNAASLSIAARLGFATFGEAVYRERTRLVLQRMRSPARVAGVASTRPPAAFTPPSRARSRDRGCGPPPSRA